MASNNTSKNNLKNNSKSNSKNDSTFHDTKQVSINNLIELLPPPYDNTTPLKSFLEQVETAFNVADSTQKRTLLLFVTKRIGIKAKEHLDMLPKKPETWPELGRILIDVYRDKRPMYQVIEELSSAKYEKGESLREFYKRLKGLEALVMEVIHVRYARDCTMPGRLAMINDLTLHRFVYHSHPGISRVLKYNTYENINQAYSAGIRIEKESSGICDICFRTNHKTEDCFQNRRKTSENASKHCDFCKRGGHSTEECWKKDKKSRADSPACSDSSDSSSSNSSVHVEVD